MLTTTIVYPSPSAAEARRRAKRPARAVDAHPLRITVTRAPASTTWRDETTLLVWLPSWAEPARTIHSVESTLTDDTLVVLEADGPGDTVMCRRPARPSTPLCKVAPYRLAEDAPVAGPS